MRKPTVIKYTGYYSYRRFCRFVIAALVLSVLLPASSGFAAAAAVDPAVSGDDLVITDTPADADIQQYDQPSVITADDEPESEILAPADAPLDVELAVQMERESIENALEMSQFDPLTYTLGPDDAVEITVMRHPEFSGTYPINRDGKLQYKFVGDIDVSGLTKKELEEKVRSIISLYVISPEVNVTIVDYKSKVFYVLGEVGTPGKYYMRSESIPIREAIFQAGLPTFSAAMRKCQIITPEKNGKIKVRKVNLYALLYGGDLKRNIDLHPGDVLYVPSTLMAKLFKMISPVTSTVSATAGAPSGVSSGKTAVENVAP